MCPGIQESTPGLVPSFFFDDAPLAWESHAGLIRPQLNCREWRARGARKMTDTASAICANNQLGEKVIKILRNMSIGPRLGTAFGCVLFFLAISVGVGVWEMQTLTDTAKRLATVESEKLQVAVRWRQGIEMNWTRTRAALQDADPKRIEAWQREMEKSAEIAVAARKRLVELVQNPESISLINEIDSAREKYRGPRGALLKRRANGEEVQSVLETELLPLADNYAGLILKLEQQQKSIFDAALVDAEKKSENAQLFMVVGGALAFVLASIFAIVLSRSIVRPLKEATEIANSIAFGDLTKSISVDGADELSELTMALQKMQHSLVTLVSRVRTGSEGVSAGSTEVAQGNQDLSTRTETQASSLQETAASMEELAATVKQNADNAHQANQLSINASSVATKGGEVVSSVVDTMKEISDRSRKIVDIISVIDGIAFQTNILALNAAVEAARAGEQGRGFAVVASEVRSLAGRSADAAKEIKALISASVERVDQGTALVNRAGATMIEVVSAIQSVTSLMGEISTASSEQATGVAQVGEAVTHMDQATQQNAALVEEMAAAASSLRAQANELVQAVSVFKIEDHRPELFIGSRKLGLPSPTAMT